MIEYTDEEVQEDRVRLISELPERYGQRLEEIHKRFEHPIAYSEILHPAFMLSETVDHYLSESPCVLFDEQAYGYAHAATAALFNLTQRLGQLRYDAEIAPKLKLNLPTPVGQWSECFFALGTADIENTVKGSLAKSLHMYQHDPDDDQPPSVVSFRQMLDFLTRHPDLPHPSMNLNRAGLFTLVYTNETGRFSIFFKYDTDVPDEAGIAEVTHTVNSPNAVGVSAHDQPIDAIKIPEWL